MHENLADIESLILRCRSEQSKNYIAEAVQCYRAGAYRSAIVSTWVAVVFDLVDKLRELAVTGEAVAIELDNRFQVYINQINDGNQNGITKALEFERDILDVCHKRLQFFDQQQLIDLNRLKEDRHRCAHPSFQQIGLPYRPSAEQARVHIRNAIVYVLSQRPVQGKAALAEIINLVASEFFAENDEKAVSQLKKTALDNPSESLVHSTIDSFVFGFLTKGHMLYQKYSAVSALNALHQMRPGPFEERIGAQISKAVRNVEDAQIFWVLFLVVYVNRAWDLIDQPARDKLILVVKKSPYGDIAPAMEALGRIRGLREVIRDRVGAFDLDELAGIIQMKGLDDVLKERAIELLAESKSWDRTNVVFDKVVLPLFSQLQSDDVKRIIELPVSRQADLPGAYGFGLFVEKVREAELISKDELDGLLLANNSGYLVSHQE